MRKAFLVSLGLILAQAGFAPAQEGDPTVLVLPIRPVSRASVARVEAIPAATLAHAPPATCGPLVTESACCKCGPRFWARAEYLHWWMKEGPVPAPLLTGGATGIVGAPTTVTLFGNSSLDYGPLSGGRLSAGYWFGAESKVGVEGSGFLLERGVSRFNAANNGLDPAQGLFFPFIDAVTGLQTAQLQAGPGGGFTAAGTFGATSTSRFWGADGSAVLNVFRSERGYVDLIGGFRYFDLDEDLIMTSSRVDSDGLFARNTFESFSTRNQFYGGQVGARFGLDFGRANVELTTKVALGNNEQTLDIRGQNTTVGAVAFVPGTNQGFIFTQPSNIGRFRNDEFAVIPQAGVKVGYGFTRNVRVTAGYDFIYWNEVARPGEQIDPVVNTTQAPSLVGGAGVLVGPARPQATFNQSDFWTHGFSLGLEITW